MYFFLNKSIAIVTSAVTSAVISVVSTVVSTMARSLASLAATTVTISAMITTTITVCSSISHAFKFSPLEAELSPSGTGSSHTFTIENQSEKRIAITAQIFQRDQNELGVETRTPTKEFSLFPEQAVIEPNQRRTLRISWMGEKIFETEKAFRLQVEQVPVGFEKSKKTTGGQIGFYLSYVASVYVTPDGAKPQIEVTVKKAQADGHDLVLQNKGKKHRILNGAKIYIIDSEGKDIEVPANVFKNLDQENILAGQTRIYDLNSMAIKSTPKGAFIKLGAK